MYCPHCKQEMLIGGPHHRCPESAAVPPTPCSDEAPWPLRDVVQKLVEAANILLDDKGYDGHGHEGIAIARDEARIWLLHQNAEQSHT